MGVWNFLHKRDQSHWVRLCSYNYYVWRVDFNNRQKNFVQLAIASGTANNPKDARDKTYVILNFYKKILEEYCQHNFIVGVRFCIHHIDKYISLCYLNIHTYVQEASKNGNLSIIKYLRHSCGEYDEKLIDTILICASRYGHINIIKYVDQRYSLNNSQYNIILRNASFGLHYPLIVYAIRKGANCWRLGLIGACGIISDIDNMGCYSGTVIDKRVDDCIIDKRVDDCIIDKRKILIDFYTSKPIDIDKREKIIKAVSDLCLPQGLPISIFTYLQQKLSTPTSRCIAEYISRSDVIEFPKPF